MRTSGRFSVRVCAGHGRKVDKNGAAGRLLAHMTGFFVSGLGWGAVRRELCGFAWGPGRGGLR